MTGRHSIRLPVELALRVDAAARACDQTIHEFILHAVAVHTAVAELREMSSPFDGETKLDSPFGDINHGHPYDFELSAGSLRNPSREQPSADAPTPRKPRAPRRS